MLSKISVSLGRRSARFESAAFAADSRSVVSLAPWLIALSVVVWIAATTASSTAQWGDHFEQFAWAHSIQWGYHKHPPLPTWILAGVIHFLGASPLWPTWLAAACMLGTAFFSYRIASELYGREVAALSLLLLSLAHAYSARASLYNHNSMMLLTVSGAVWCVLLALGPERRPVIWCLAGTAAALAVLSKYQAVVPLAGAVLALWLAGDLDDRRHRRGLLLAVLVALALLTPHLLWLAQGHAAAVDYATQQGRALSAAERLWNVTSFLAQQLRYMIGPLVLFGLLAVMPGSRPWRRRASDWNRQRAWMCGLVAFPICATVLIGPLFGIELQNHWGYQALQFSFLWLAWRLRPLAPAAGAAWWVSALTVHAVLLAVALVDFGPANAQARNRVDARFPAQGLADAVAADWAENTLCPLRIVVGPMFEASIVSVYNGGAAAVLEEGDFRKSPWVLPADIERLGAVYIASDPALLPHEGVSTLNWMEVGGGARGPARRLHWAIIPPGSCAP